MKKIYALIAVAAAGVMTASAFNGMPFEGGKKDVGNPIPASEVITLNPSAVKSAKSFTLKGFSRADEMFTFVDTVNTFDQQLYYLYDYNFKYENGASTVEGETFYLTKQSCVNTQIEASEDLSKIYIKSLMDFEVEGDGIELVFNPETGKFDMELGQLVFEDSRYGEATLGNYPSSGLTVEGKLEWSLFKNALVLDSNDMLCITIMDGGKRYYFGNASCYGLRIFQPNAVLNYHRTLIKEDGTVVANEDVANTVLFEEYEPDDSNPNDLGGFMISNVLPSGDGFVTYFDYVELKNGDLVILYDFDSPVGPSRQVSQTDYTGYYYMLSQNLTTEEVSGDVFAEYDLNEKTLTWPVVPESFAAQYEGFVDWVIYSTNSYWYGDLTQAKLTLKDPLAGVSSAVVEEVEGPAEYYNLQGIKVANPAAGQIYIVKEGSKVSKRVF